MTLTITLEVKTVGDLERLSKALAPFLLQLSGKPGPEQPDPDTCTEHDVPWKRYEKGEKHWQAHRLPDGAWCHRKN